MITYNIEHLDDYIHIQKQVYKTLQKNGFFTNENNSSVAVKNESSGMIIEINRKGIKETLNKKNTDHKKRGFPTITIGAPISIDGKRGNLGVVIKMTDANRYSAHRILLPNGSVFVLERENAEVTNIGSTAESSSPRPTITSASEKIVAR